MAKTFRRYLRSFVDSTKDASGAFTDRIAGTTDKLKAGKAGQFFSNIFDRFRGGSTGRSASARRGSNAGATSERSGRGTGSRSAGKSSSGSRSAAARGSSSRGAARSPEAGESSRAATAGRATSARSTGRSSSRKESTRNEASRSSGRGESTRSSAAGAQPQRTQSATGTRSLGRSSNKPPRVAH